ncbi:MAG: site-2 protease family protein [Candidatus Pacebacteria bacterium]|jgi:Zn-dependent protease|nr:site-2 protease family protein [Candidatus Paceibacterota bacterium]
MQVETLFFLIILIFSIIIHEIAHGYMAEWFGDPTARLAGRLTLNPVPHIDPLGSIILPALMLLGSGGSFAFGWAKPVPYNPYNLRNFKWGTIFVGVAGVLANLLLALIFGLMLRYNVELGIEVGPFTQMLGTIVYLNIVLAVFNMIPFPPLDGAKVLFTLLPYRFQKIHDYLEANWLIFIVFVVFFASTIISPISSLLFRVITGVGLF